MSANWLPFAKTHRGVTTIRRGRGSNQQPSPPPLLPYRQRSHGGESVILDESMGPDGLISCEATTANVVDVDHPRRRRGGTGTGTGTGILGNLGMALALAGSVSAAA